MLDQIIDNIEGILIELKDNNVNYNIDIKDRRFNFLKLDIVFGENFPIVNFFDNNYKMYPYISNAFLTLESYLEKNDLDVKVHCRRRFSLETRSTPLGTITTNINNLYKSTEGFSVSLEEFTKIDPRGLNIVVIGISRKISFYRKIRKKIDSYSKFNESFSKGSIKEFCEDHLAYLLDNDEYTLSIQNPAPAYSSRNKNEGFTIRLYRKGDFIKWDNIKDFLIPFFSILVRNFNCFPNIIFSFEGMVDREYNINELIKDTISINRKFNVIIITLRANQKKYKYKYLSE